MYLKKMFILFLILLSVLILIAACASNRDETNPSIAQSANGTDNQTVPPATSDYKGVDLPPIPDPAKGNPKLAPHLEQLIEAEKRGELESWARQRSITLVDGSVRVTIDCAPGQVEAAAKAATNVGAKPGTSYENLLNAVVPITSLITLANEESIISIKLPPPPTLD